MFQPIRERTKSARSSTLVRKFVQLVAKLGVDGDHCVMGSPGCFKILLALCVAPVNLRPVRRDEDAGIVAKSIGSLSQVIGQRQPLEAQIADDVRHSAVEQHRASSSVLGC